MSVLLGLGNGIFAPRTDYPVETHPFSLAVGDVDGNSNLDIVTANHYSENVSVLIGLGNGTFAPRTDYTLGVSAWSMALGDLDLDGNQDIVTAGVY